MDNLTVRVAEEGDVDELRFLMEAHGMKESRSGLKLLLHTPYRTLVCLTPAGSVAAAVMFLVCPPLLEVLAFYADPCWPESAQLLSLLCAGAERDIVDGFALRQIVSRAGTDTDDGRALLAGAGFVGSEQTWKRPRVQRRVRNPVN